MDNQNNERRDVNHSRGSEMIQENEQLKARIMEVPGEQNIQGITVGNINVGPSMNLPLTPHLLQATPSHSSVVDEDYLLVGNYLDENIKRRIGNGEFVDFAKLMPRDRVDKEEDQRMEIVNRGGMSYWVPIADRESVASINCYARWEQAFRVYSNVYTKFHPNRACELIQYSHTIHTESQSFQWDNIYRYDKEFRIHMSKHHLQRNWGIILQQAWSMFLKDKIGQNGSQYGKNSGNNVGATNNPTSNLNTGGVRRRLCFDFNRGTCTFGRRCKFDHRCAFCNRYGHGAFNCHRANNGKSGGGNFSNNNNHHGSEGSIYY